MRVFENSYGNKSFTVDNYKKIDDIFIKKIFIKVDRLTDDIKNKIVVFQNYIEDIIRFICI